MDLNIDTSAVKAGDLQKAATQLFPGEVFSFETARTWLKAMEEGNRNRTLAVAYFMAFRELTE